MNLRESRPLKPNSGDQRIYSLDALRGVAVLGIFLINIIGFGLPGIGFSNPVVAGGDGALNYGLWTVTTVFFEGAMRGLFSIMFGAGIVLFCSRAPFPDGPIAVADLYYRRTLWLVVFGLVHGYALLMPGDILLIYGLAGLALFPFRVLSGRWAAILACCLMLALMISNFASEWSETLLAEQFQDLPAAESDRSDAQNQVAKQWQQIYAGNWPPAERVKAEVSARTGSAVSVYTDNARLVMGNSSASGLLWWVTDAAFMMLLGMALFRWGVLTGQRSRKLYRRMALSGYAVGIALRSWFVMQRWEADFSPALWAWSVFDQVGRVAMTLGHVGLFFLLWNRFRSSSLMRALTAAGRMALTNYIGQTFIANLIFTGVGLGLYGSMDRVQLYGTLLVIWTGQLLSSVWWLNRFRYGPLEWGWRTLTYWRRVPLKL